MTMPQKKTELGSVDILRIMELLPHRYPFLMVDRIVDMQGDLSAVGIKNVTINEPFFAGHFPGMPVMPGVLLIEGMAQTAGALVINNMDESAGDADRIVYFMTIDKARFRQPVVPGDTVHYAVEQMRHRANVWKFKGETFVDDKLVAEAELSAMIANRDS